MPTRPAAEREPAGMQQFCATCDLHGQTPANDLEEKREPTFRGPDCHGARAFRSLACRSADGRPAVTPDRLSEYVSLRSGSGGPIAVYVRNAFVSIACRPAQASMAQSQVPGSYLREKTSATTDLVVPSDVLEAHHLSVLTLAEQALDWRSSMPDTTGRDRVGTSPPGPGQTCPSAASRCCRTGGATSRPRLWARGRRSGPRRTNERRRPSLSPRAPLGCRPASYSGFSHARALQYRCGSGDQQQGD